MISSDIVIKRAISNLVLKKDPACTYLPDKVIFYLILDICIAIQRVIQIRIRELHIHASTGEFKQFDGHYTAI